NTQANRMSSTNFEQCLATIMATDALWRTGGTDLNGNLVANKSQVVGMTYAMCVTQCGTAPEAFNFPSFSTQFSSFMLPFLALTAQLPFGATNHIDNFSTIMLTIGSPTLAIFSLVITVCNSRWIKWRFERISYPNSNHAVIILDNLQESLLRVNKTSLDGRPLLASQIVLPENDQWWQRGADVLAFTQTWSMTNIASVGWAVIAYIFTIASMDPSNMNVIGPAVACAWIWLLPVVVGWLQTSPNCDEAKIRTKIAALNEIRYICQPGDDPAAPPVPVRDSTAECAIEVWPLHSDTCDECRSPPFYNFARVFSWGRSVEEIALSFEAASIRASNRLTVDGSQWTHSVPGAVSVLDPGTVSVRDPNRSGKAEDVAKYIEPQGHPQPQCWTPGVWRRVAYSSVVACAVQWSCTGSAVLAAWMTPTVGLGCHSASFLLYGALSTISFIIIMAGVVTQQRHHVTNPLSHSLSPSAHRRYARLSILCRRVGKTMAWVNACLFITLDLLRFSNIFGNCFCGSSVFGLGVNRAYNIVTYDSSMHFENWWIAAIALASV
ncbi:hypothetical protein B0H19DRAFT_861515, partial [Mycena capillaripes]